MTVWLLLSGTLAVRTNRDLNSSRELAVHAYTDVLTALGNRRALAERLEHLIANPVLSGSTVLLVDLDGFKKVNDTFGHGVGDELLVVAAKRIESNLRDCDLAVRLGGDEFAIVLDEGGLAKAKEVATRMILLLAAPITLSRIRLSVTASIGIVEIVPPSEVEEILSHADLAMYQAKAAGRNQVTVYEPALHFQMVRRLEVEAELRDAVDGEEFEPHFQPIVHMGTGTVIGVEALARSAPSAARPAPPGGLSRCLPGPRSHADARRAPLGAGLPPGAATGSRSILARRSRWRSTSRPTRRSPPGSSAGSSGRSRRRVCRRGC